jgi:hypothetical protein
MKRRIEPERYVTVLAFLASLVLGYGWQILWLALWAWFRWRNGR